MNRLLLFIAFIFLSANIKAQTLDASYFLDFGLNNGTAGDITGSPDVNNNSWNNITDPNITAAPVSLIKSNGGASGINLTITSAFVGNGKADAGGLMSPSASLLGDFAVTTATQDYFYTPTGAAMQLNGLNPAKIYVFKIFGTRAAIDARTSQYKIKGANTSVKTLQTTGTAIGNDSYNGNNNIIVVSDYIIPTEEGTVAIELSKTVGSFGYVGVIKIEEYTPPSEYQYNKLNTSYFLDFGLNNGLDGDETISPDAKGNHWNNITDRMANSTTVNLKNNTGGSSSIDLIVTTTFVSNGKRNGGLLAPSSALLGEFAIATATSDYFFVDAGATPKGALRLSGLDPAKSYVFKIFGTREAADTRTSQYKITGANTSTKMLTTTGTNVGSSYNGNNNTIVISDYVKPTPEGIIDIELSKVAGDFGYLAILKIEEYALTTLPVQLKSFNGNVTTNGVKLVWTTASEQNVNRFEVESKFDNSDFKKIATVTATGNSNQLLTYSVTDKNQYPAGNVYYRLKTIDNNGEISYSEVIDVKLPNLNKQKLSVYPNPFTNKLKVTCPDATKGKVIIRIINSNGALVKETASATEETTIDTSALTTGTYILTVISNGKTVSTQKIVKL